MKQISVNEIEVNGYYLMIYKKSGSKAFSMLFIMHITEIDSLGYFGNIFSGDYCYSLNDCNNLGGIYSPYEYKMDYFKWRLCENEYIFFKLTDSEILRHIVMEEI